MNEAKKLKKDTLYIPDFVRKKYGRSNAEEEVGHTIEGLVGSYPYPYKFIPQTELTAMILDAGRPIYYVSLIKSNYEMYFAVVNSATGEHIHRRYTPMAANVGAKEFKKIVKAIDKL